MVKNRTRRNFLCTASFAAAAVTLPLADKPLVAQAQSQAQPAAPVPFQLITADDLVRAIAQLHAHPGNDNLFASEDLPFTVVLTTEEKKSAREFEYHEGRDHIFQILEGATIYQLGGTPQSPHSTGPGEWLAPDSAGATILTLHKGDMLVIPRGTPHKRITEASVTLLLISTTGSVKV